MIPKLGLNPSNGMAARNRGANVHEALGLHLTEADDNRHAGQMCKSRLQVRIQTNGNRKNLHLASEQSPALGTARARAADGGLALREVSLPQGGPF